MPTTDSEGVAHYDLKNAEDLAALIANGLIWKGGPKAQQMAVRAILDGNVPRPANLPPEVASFIDQHMDPQSVEPGA